MKQLEKLTEIIKLDQTNWRFNKASLVKQLDTEKLAIKTARKLIVLQGAYVPLTSFAGSLGKHILSGFENQDDTEKAIKKSRIQCGLAIIRALKKADIVDFKQSKGQGQWLILVKNDQFVNDLSYHFPVEKMQNFKFPSVNKPKERHNFYDIEGGPLVTNLDRRNIKAFNYDAIPLVYKQINDLNAIAYRINDEVLEAIKFNQDKPLFTFKNKILTKEAIVGLQRDKNITLGLAESLQGKDFYFYWNLDRRGRFYCASTYLTTQGSKLSKSLIYLKEKQKLGERGLYWLMVHIANCMGQDKLPIQERFLFAQNALEDILYCGRNPNTTYSFWSQQDDPYGFLAAAIELAYAYELENPEDFESGLLIGFDATTSGLQIMAMLSRDHITGALCNLENSSIVGDIYLYIADKIWNDLSKFWKDKHKMRRAIVKRSVMTFFYSCGWRTMGDHIIDDFKSEFKGLTIGRANELGKAIYQACIDHLPGAAAIMDLFIEIGKAAGEDDLRVNGLSNNFPFIQTYRKPKIARLKFKVDDQVILLNYIAEEGVKVDKNKIKTASSPNIVHHLDSQIVAELLRIADYTIVPVHDCFTCIPSQADKMYQDIRSAFYLLFGERDVLQELCDSHNVDNVIVYGKLDTKAMLTNEYCFS